MTSTPEPRRPDDRSRADMTSTAAYGSPAGEYDVEVTGLSSDDKAAVEALPASSALLIVQRGPNAGARFLLDDARITAGRHPRSDIFLDDVTVSRKHAEFLYDEAAFTVRDVGSLNGTYVNRQRIDQVVLRAGDEVQIGKYRLTFHPSPHRQERSGTAPEGVGVE